MMYGRDPVLPTEEALSQSVYLEYDNYWSVVQNLSDSWTTARQNVQKQQYDKKTRMPTFQLAIVFVYMPATKSGKAYKLSRPFYGPYRIITLHDNGADVKPVDRPQDATIRVPFARLRACPSEIADVSWPPKKPESATAARTAASAPATAVAPPAVMPTKMVTGMWKGRLRARKRK